MAPREIFSTTKFDIYKNFYTSNVILHGQIMTDNPQFLSAENVRH